MATTTPLAVSSTPLPAPTATPLRACAPDDPEDADAVVVGVILPLSPPGEYEAGFDMQAAINMALQDINESGGVRERPLRIVTYNSTGVPRQGAIFAERLVTLDCASIIVGLYHSNVAAAVSDVASRHNVPLILAAPAADELTADQRQAVFRLGPTHTMEDQQLAAWLAEVAAAHKDALLSDDHLTIFIVAENRQNEREEAEQISLWLEQAGFTAKSHFVDLPTQDYSPVIARIVTLDMFPDVVVNRLTDQPALDFHRQLLDAGVSPQNGTIIVTGDHALDDNAFWAAIPDGAGSVVYHDGPWRNTMTATESDFVEQYEEQFGSWPAAHAFAAHDALHLAVDALNRASTWSFPDLVDTLAATDASFSAGHYYFPYHSSNPPVDERTPDFLWHQWPDPPLLFLQYTEPGQSSAEMPVLWPPTYRTVDGPYVDGPYVDGDD